MISTIGLLFALQFRSVQTFFVNQAAHYLSKELHTTVAIKGFYFKPFSSLVLENVYIEDQERDTLLQLHALSAQLDLRQLTRGLIRVNKLSLENGDIYLKKTTDSTTNLSFILNYFRKPKQENNKSSLEVRLEALALQSVHFTYQNELNRSLVRGVNFNDIAIEELSGNLSAIDFKQHLFKADVKDLHFREKSGFVLKRLDAKVVVDTNSMEFQQLYAETNASRVGNYLKFNYGSFSSFSHFISQVEVKANIRNSRIASRDIAYFAPSVSRLHFNAAVSGDIQGKVNAFSGKNVLIQGGKATYFKGDLKVTGLPAVNETLFEIEADQLSSNKQDAEQLIADFSGHDVTPLPEFLSSFGHVSYAGSLIGLYNKFHIKGNLKTIQGLLNADLVLNLADSNSYQGSLSSDKFNVGEALSIPDLGEMSFNATVDGAGFSKKTLQGSGSVTLDHVLYRGYRYQHIQIDLKAFDQSLQGTTEVLDSYLKMKLKGTADFKGSFPHYTADATVEKLDLKALHLTKDTLAVDGLFHMDITGDELNNLEGDLALKSLVFRKPTTSSAVDSIQFSLHGTGDARMLALHSDIADATVHGEIDLNGFPDYFKSIVQKYIPSWNEKLNPGKQAFDFALRLKKMDALTAIFFPAVHLPDTSVINGKFSTADEIASLNGYIPTLQIGQIKIKDIIVDQTATQESLDVTLTADQLNITDSLYVRNINLSNRLRNDSLNFNVKLSDIDARNQLDLNGLVEFRENRLAMLSLLPSNVLINRESWALEEKVNFNFEDEGMKIEGFELANGRQHVLVDGLISGNDKDVLHVNFKQFNLTSLDGLTNPLGIALKGELNGDFTIVSILKNPYVSADIKSSDIFYNGKEIGDMTMMAELDPKTELIGVQMEIQRQDVQTLKITGTYNAKAKENSLDLQAHLENSELVIFEPFLKKLVSDISGTVSADIAIGGTPLSPSISGECAFNQASFTVNYLKTRYTINDQVAVDNSTIALNQLEIRDVDNHRAVATGTVNMRNPLDPDIEVNVKAERFMVLNTTAKDNALYYGKAFGTGDFRFKGLTSNMNIDIKAATEEGTVFNIPLNNTSGTVGEHDFITFVSKDSSFTEPKRSYFEGLTMHIDLDINRNAETNIYTDMGKLSGIGTGNITMDITSFGDFEMFGDYVIGQGKFTFTAQDFINKIFEISRGGTIRWTGNPSEALINLTAVYEVRTSVGPLYNAAGRPGTNQRVVAQAEMNLAGNLLHPDISFALEFPTDAYVKDELQSYLSDANNVNQQALSLIVRRSFSPGTGTDLTTELNSTVLSAGTELAFNQLNNVISQSLNLNFVDFNIRSLNEASASIRLLKNRLILTGGVTDRRSELNDLNLFGNQVASDVEALYLIRKDGSLLFRASNRLNNRNFLNPNDEYVSALGLVYRKEFDTLGEFFRHMFTISRKKEEDEEKQKSDAKQNAKGSDQ